MSNMKKEKKRMRYKYACGTIVIIDIFAICKCFKTFFYIMKKTHTNRNEIEIGLKHLYYLQTCLINQR